MMHRLSFLSVVVLFTLTTTASISLAADRGKEPMYRINSVPSGYDPFVFNSHTGRFDYVPIPYEPQRPGSGYDPFRINWHSGTFDYVPIPLQSDYDFAASQHDDGGGRSINTIDTRLNGAAGPIRNLPPRPPPNMSTPPVLAPGTQYNVVTVPVRSRRPATRPSHATTAPSSPAQPPMGDGFVRLTGHWEFDAARGRWIFVLPPG
jgi:hypothetical protein